jgi:hypothetical protein
VQILHPFAGPIQQYAEEITDPDRHRPTYCPQCQAPHSLTAHGFYSRTLVDAGFDGSIRVRRYLCRSCKRTVSLLPEFALPYLRFGITVISLFLVARLLQGATLAAAAAKAAQTAMPYQRGQFWIHRFQLSLPQIPSRRQQGRCGLHVSPRAWNDSGPEWRGVSCRLIAVRNWRRCRFVQNLMINCDKSGHSK